MIMPGLDGKVRIDVPTHSYWHEDGRQFMSVSKFLQQFYSVFDVKIISMAVAKKRGISSGVVQKEWSDYAKERQEQGTRIHAAIERFEQTLKILPEDEELREGVYDVVGKYAKEGYYRMYQEQLLYDEESGIAGMADKICVLNKGQSIIDIADYKNYSKGLPQVDVMNNGKKKLDYMNGPVSHLIDSKYNRVALQLSMYAYMAEKKLECKIGKLYTHVIPPENMKANYFVPVNYLKSEVMELLLVKKIQDVSI